MSARTWNSWLRSPPIGPVSARIGIAVSDPDRIFSGPYENYNRRSKKKDAARFQELVREERIVQFVVGLPIHLDGRESEKSLYDDALVTFEDDEGAYDQRDAKGFIRLNALRLRTLGMRDRR